MFKYISLFVVLLLLSSCAPKFEIKKSFNEFRNISKFEMSENLVPGKFGKIGYKLYFNIRKEQLLTQNRTNYEIKLSTEQATGFKSNSIMLISLNGSEQLRLEAKDGNSSASVLSGYSPGYFINGTYIAGHSYSTTLYYSYALYDLTDENLNKLLTAKNIDLALETEDGRKVTASFSKDNINNLTKFNNECN
jgi:hypothetical protein